MNQSEARQLLSVDVGASESEIRAAYRRELKRWHPDRFVRDAAAHPIALRRTQRINDAWAVLRAGSRVGVGVAAPTWQGRPIRRVENWPRVFWVTFLSVVAVSALMGLLSG